jgi:hypothetical protein
MYLYVNIRVLGIPFYWQIHSENISGCNIRIYLCTPYIMFLIWIHQAWNVFISWYIYPTQFPIQKTKDRAMRTTLTTRVNAGALKRLAVTRMLHPPQWGDYRIVITPKEHTRRPLWNIYSVMIYQVMESIKQPSKWWL